MKLPPIKRAAVIAAGSVLFFLLGAFVSIPSPIETVNICVQYGWLAFLSVVCGPLTGTLVGLLGHIGIDLYFGELCWSWIIASSAFGALLGVLANVTGLRTTAHRREALVHFNLCQVAVHVVCWAGVAPVLELLLYAENMDRICEQGLTAAISNAVTTAIVGSLLLKLHTLHKKRKTDHFVRFF